MAAFVSPSNGHDDAIATLDDYTNFHGMLCRPSTAQRCIHSFSGTILFMPFTCDTSERRCLARYDYSGEMLNLWSYYLLVVFSFTGLSTLLKQTKFLVAEDAVHVGEYVYPKQQRQNHQLLPASNCNPHLSVDQNILDYVMQQSESLSLQLARRFEYHFGGILPVSVIMLHFVCDKGLLHLVEVYELERWPKAFSLVADTLSDLVRWIAARRVKQD